MPTPTQNQKNIRVVMFPWLGYGHISPFLELARKLSHRNFTFHICSTSATLSPIIKNLENNEESFKNVKFEELELPASADLPPQYHTTNGLPPALMSSLKDAFDSSRPNFARLLRAIAPDLLIYDFLQPWAAEEAGKLNIPAVEFISSSATMTSQMVHEYKRPKDAVFPFPNIYYHDYELARIRRDEAEADPEQLESDARRVTDSFDLSRDFVMIKTFDEIEAKYSDYITELSGKKVVPLGPLVVDPSPKDGDSEVIQWLNTKPEKSTVFVSFGSEYFLSRADMTEIALGLELSNVNFVWVLRFPKGEETDLEQVLPEGYIGRVGGRGLVVQGWAPQAKILQHSSIGGFVSHCGWSSVMESMKYGVPIIAMPMHIDQPFNARLAIEVGVAVEVIRDSSEKLHRDEMAKVIDSVVLEKEGGGVRAKAVAMREMLAKKGDKEIDLVAEELRKLCDD